VQSTIDINPTPAAVERVKEQRIGHGDAEDPADGENENIAQRLLHQRGQAVAHDEQCQREQDHPDDVLEQVER
jgi:hypothetical protein